MHRTKMKRRPRDSQAMNKRGSNSFSLWIRNELCSITFVKQTNENQFSAFFVLFVVRSARRYASHHFSSKLFFLFDWLDTWWQQQKILKWLVWLLPFWQFKPIDLWYRCVDSGLLGLRLHFSNSRMCKHLNFCGNWCDNEANITIAFEAIFHHSAWPNERNCWTIRFAIRICRFLWSSWNIPFLDGSFQCIE